jgi:asparagine synthase (glutamine-hydrolysing)
MCGIITVLNPSIESSCVIKNFNKSKHRGPDHTDFKEINTSVWMGFHRLAINGLTNLSSQPFHIQGIYLVCNGEIYNYKELYTKLKITPTTESDCEIIVHLYLLYGIDQMVHMLDASEFSFVLYDSTKNEVYTVRDPYGVRPLYHSTLGEMHIFSSEMKMVNDLNMTFIEHHKPGTISRFVEGKLQQTYTYITHPPINNSITKYGQVTSLIHDTLYECVKQRVLNTERGVACLLSGGLDSSIITALVNSIRKSLGITEPLETYSIGLEGAEDLKYAAIVAKYLGTKHTNIIVKEDDFFNAIPDIIYTIESYDTTTVRASTGNYLVCKEIAKLSQAKVIFNGDGSDEVTGGYLYMKKCPNEFEFDAECRRLTSDIYLFDSLRSDKSISCNGLEARTPFLDKAFVHMYLSLPAKLRFTPHCEKHWLRKSFETYLPPEIIWRTKEAFSDGVSALNRSWYQIIQEKIPYGFNQIDHTYKHNPPTTPEQMYYRTIFESRYGNHVKVVPYFWMPKYSTTKDCSARTLEHYAV